MGRPAAETQKTIDCRQNNPGGVFPTSANLDALSGLPSPTIGKKHRRNSFSTASQPIRLNLLRVRIGPAKLEVRAHAARQNSR